MGSIVILCGLHPVAEFHGHKVGIIILSLEVCVESGSGRRSE